jgi:hypothetical protein
MRLGSLSEARSKKQEVRSKKQEAEPSDNRQETILAP